MFDMATIARFKDTFSKKTVCPQVTKQNRK